LIRKIEELEKALLSKTMWIEAHEKGIKDLREKNEKVEKEKLALQEKTQKFEVYLNVLNINIFE
jgi:hypothetical protein